MKLCPPKPGLTLITSTRSTSPSTWLDGGDRRRRVERHAGLLAERLDQLQRAVEMRPGFGMDGDDVGAGGGEFGDIGIGRRDHQMDVEGERRIRAQRLHHAGPDGDVGHEMPVHHIDMDVVGAGRRRWRALPRRAVRNRPRGSRARCVSSAASQAWYQGTAAAASRKLGSGCACAPTVRRRSRRGRSNCARWLGKVRRSPAGVTHSARPPISAGSMGFALRPERRARAARST